MTTRDWRITICGGLEMAPALPQRRTLVAPR